MDNYIINGVKAFSFKYDTDVEVNKSKKLLKHQ